jgi:hypothetical protein
MTLIPWVGTKKVAFVPVFREIVPPDVMPPDWRNVILNRVINDIRPQAGGVDRSLRAWLQRVSFGRADIEPDVREIRTVTQEAVEPGHFANEDPNQQGSLNEQRLKDEGFSSAILIMLGTINTGTTNGFWSRVAMAEGNGTWLHEIFHAITGLQDLYHFNNDIDPAAGAIGLFDVMSAGQQTHPTAFTKNHLHWLDDLSIGRYTIGSGLSGFILHPVGSLQAPTHSGEVHGIRIGDDVPYFMVEARQKTDHFEAGISIAEMGIPSEGVIAYRVRTRDPSVQKRPNCRKSVYLETLTALQPGQSILLDNVNVRVVQQIPKGYIVHVTTEPITIPGIGQVLVPNVIGMDWEAAERLMVQQGLCTRISGPKDAKIQSQSVPGGALALWGTEIELARSATPPPTCPPGQHLENGVCVPDVITPPPVTVPNVTTPALHPTIAKIRIQNAGLSAHMIGCSHENCFVTTQDPEAGKLVPKDSTVTCTSEDITL